MSNNLVSDHVLLLQTPIQARLLSCRERRELIRLASGANEVLYHVELGRKVDGVTEAAGSHSICVLSLIIKVSVNNDFTERS